MRGQGVDQGQEGERAEYIDQGRLRPGTGG